MGSPVYEYDEEFVFDKNHYAAIVLLLMVVFGISMIFSFVLTIILKDFLKALIYSAIVGVFLFVRLTFMTISNMKGIKTLIYQDRIVRNLKKTKFFGGFNSVDEVIPFKDVLHIRKLHDKGFIVNSRDRKIDIYNKSIVGDFPQIVNMINQSGAFFSLIADDNISYSSNVNQEYLKGQSSAYKVRFKKKNPFDYDIFIDDNPNSYAEMKPKDRRNEIFGREIVKDGKRLYSSTLDSSYGNIVPSLQSKEYEYYFLSDSNEFVCSYSNFYSVGKYLTSMFSEISIKLRFGADNLELKGSRNPSWKNYATLFSNNVAIAEFYENELTNEVTLKSLSGRIPINYAYAVILVGIEKL